MRADTRPGASILHRLILVAFIVLSSAAASFGANVFVPTFDLTSWVDQDAKIETRADFELSFEGGYKFQAKVAFEYYNLDLEGNPYQAIIFDGANATLKDLFSFLDITYWTGFYEVLGMGKHYAGHLYHRESGFEYEGFYPVVGTGLLFTGHITETMSAGVSAYQRTGSGYINSADFIYSLGSGNLNFDLYAGISDQVYRAGTQFSFIGNEIEFYLTTGNLTIAEGSTFNFDDFYFLAEELFKMNRWDLVLSVFTRPRVHYRYDLREYADTNERNDVDFNFDLGYTTKKGTLTAGGELNVRTNSVEDLGFTVSPYLEIFTLGLAWKVKLNFGLLSQSGDVFNAYLNLQSSF